MNKPIARATSEGTLKFGEIEIPCAVLDNGKRVLMSNGFLTALGRPWRGTYKRTELPNFIDQKSLRPFISEDLRSVLLPHDFMPLKGKMARGFEAELLPLVCDVYAKAEAAGVTTKLQETAVHRAKIILRSLAKVGIVALVDEATGYQTLRAKNELQQILAMYVRAEFLPWMKTFPEEFYKEMFRLRGLDYDPSSLKRPWVFAQDTVEIVYKRFPIGVYENLVRLNPKDNKGHRKHKLHQFLTSEIGRPHLEKHLTAVMAIQRLSPNWARFMNNMERSFPKNNQLSFELDDDIFILPEDERQLNIKIRAS